jgi:hypothetical protein
MYKSIHIQNFRGLRDLRIDDLGRVNLIVGANNVGKTSVLEALCLMHAHLDGYDLGLLVESRGYRADQSLVGALTDFVSVDGGDTFRISGERCDGAEGELVGYRTIPRQMVNADLEAWYLASLGGIQSRENLQLIYYLHPASGTITEVPSPVQQQMPIALGGSRPYPRPFHRGHFGEMMYSPATPRLTTLNLADLLSQLEQRSDMSRVVSALTDFDSRLADLFVGYSLEDQQPTVNAKIGVGDGTFGLPLNLLGDGTRRLTDLLVLLPLARGGIGLIDEIESGMYHQNLSTVWPLVDALSDDNEVQVFATTHSWECVVAAVSAFRESPDDFRLHRLERQSLGDGIRVITYDHELAQAAVTGFVEVR